MAKKATEIHSQGWNFHQPVMEKGGKHTTPFTPIPGKMASDLVAPCLDVSAKG